MADAPGDNDATPESDLALSKSERKRRMLALQELGETLVQLSEPQLANIPIEDEMLLKALSECRNIRSNSARKRQLQYIGKLMRSVDVEPIRRALDSRHQAQRADTQAFHELEQMRDAILAAGDNGIELALQRWPAADRQHIRQLVRQHSREIQQGKPPAASRKLFRYLRNLQPP